MFEQIVKDWLQDTAPGFEPCEIKRNHLQYTLDHLSKSKSLSKMGISDKQKMSGTVTELDPDATSRQKKLLISDDMVYFFLSKEFEHNLNWTIFQYIRRGKLDEALELCQDCNQPWKAATLMGGIFHGDPLIDAEKDGMHGGNQNRSLWKAACYALANETSIEKYERAIYGALAGDVNTVLPACKTFEDVLWAYFSAIIEGKFQKVTFIHFRGFMLVIFKIFPTKLPSLFPWFWLKSLKFLDCWTISRILKFKKSQRACSAWCRDIVLQMILENCLP
jgi:nuclear pore complex protein Nup107